MSFKVPVTRILNITPHSNAERLEIATIYGFQVVIPKGRYGVNSKVVYIPVDSILPADIETKLFPPEAKIKLHHNRVRQIRIRGLASQGMVVDPDDLESFVSDIHNIEDESDLATILDINKYEPPAPSAQQGSTRTGMRRNKRTDHSLFHSYNGLDNIKWTPFAFDGEEVVVEEKLHGTNCRVSLLPSQPNTFWKKVQKFFGILPKYEINYGSNNVQISRQNNYVGFYGEDIYARALKSVDAFKKLKPNEIVYGEVIGDGIQKNYHYGHTTPTFVVFDVKEYNENTGEFRWLSAEEVTTYCSERGFSRAPVLYTGLYDKELVQSLTKGPSVYNPSQKVREGVVIKSRTGYNNIYCHSQRKSLKLISEDYLDDKSNTDNH